MELSVQIMMLIFMGIATWAAMSTAIIFFTQPASINSTYDWAVPSAYAIVSVVFGLFAVLTTPISEII